MTGGCSDITSIGFIGWVVFTIFGILSWLLGTQRGNDIITMNYHTVSYIIYLLVLFYSATSHKIFCLDNWKRDDGLKSILLNRIFIATSMFCGFVILMIDRIDNYKPSQIIVHLVMAILSQALWVGAILSFEKNIRFFFGYSSISLSILLLLHLYSETNIIRSRNPNFMRYILVCITIYFIVYYVVMLWGNLFENFISFLIQEIILFILDIFATILICITIIHNGWAIIPIKSINTPPNVISNLNNNQINEHVTNMHIIDSGY